MSIICTGLPVSIKDKVLWVSDDLRTNSLSLTPGGSNVVVEYQRGDVLGYCRIKYPSSYIAQIVGKEISNIYVDFDVFPKLRQIDIIREQITSVHALKYDKNVFGL